MERRGQAETGETQTMVAEWGRNRKRGRREPADRSEWSVVLREIGTAIQRREYEIGLKRLDDELRRRKDVTEQSRLLALAGDSEFKRGRYEEAAAIYLKSARLGLGHGEVWFRGLVGCVRALLKAGDEPMARMVAQHAVAVAEEKHAAFERVVSTAGVEMRRRGVMVVPPVPVRISVVATRMGNLFLEEGELEAAEEMFQAAVQSTRGEGACRARIGLARIALMRGEAEAALQGAQEALWRGEFRAKTLEAWEVVIAARRALGGWQIKGSLLRGVERAPAGVRARAVLAIVREMARHDMRQGEVVAERWLAAEGASNPIIAAELLKVLLARARREEVEERRVVELAGRLLATPKLDRMEWLAVVKMLVVGALRKGQLPGIEGWLKEAEQRYGRGWSLQVAHSLALVLMEWRQHKEARALLESVVQGAERDSAVWGRAVWALARMESALGRVKAAAQGYRQYYEASGMPKRFRLQARLLWAQVLAASGAQGQLSRSRMELEEVLKEVEDPVMWMNFARQVLAAGPEMGDWAREIFARGKAKALERFEKAGHPSVAVAVLFELTRRQVCDFGETREVIRFWEQLPLPKRSWLWSGREEFWEYLGWVLEAYIREGERAAAEAFARTWLEDAATPDMGLVHVGVVYGRWLVRRGEVGQALVWFERVIRAGPRHPLSGLAWYWKALKAHREGNREERDRCLRSLREAQGARPSLWYQWTLDAKSVLLLADLDIGRAEKEAPRYRRGDWEQLRNEVLREMEEVK